MISNVSSGRHCQGLSWMAFRTSAIVGLRPRLRKNLAELALRLALNRESPAAETTGLGDCQEG